ncbi:MAG: Rne/Rng family ribonuclease [Synergistota bacterium]|nr:Rne/Rng family ribonuclease [Synergistota bacterium]
MNRQGRSILSNGLDPEECRVAVLEEGKLREMYVERMWERQRAGDIYKARVDSVVPGMNAAFLNLGDGRNAFLYLEDVKGGRVEPNQEMVVQVTKTARKGKGARVTPRISIPGRYMVLIPGGRETGVSRRIDSEERERLRRVARDMRPGNAGVIVRTAAGNVGEEELESDLKYLENIWEEIERESKQQNAPCLLYQDTGLLGRVLRDELNHQVGEIIVDSPEEFTSVENFLGNFGINENAPSLDLYTGTVPLFEFYGVEDELEAALDRKVWLESGAYLVIDQTEALTVIDVNTGKFTGGENLRGTVLKTNLEAAVEISRQLRLRAIGGIVVVDFIDMENHEDRVLLTERLEGLFRNDRHKARVYGITKLGLVELTRKRSRADMRSVFTRGCPCCGGSGWVRREENVAMNIKRFLRKVVLSSHCEALLVEVHPEIASTIARDFLRQWEESLNVRIYAGERPDMPWDKYRLEAQGSVEQIERRAAIFEDREKGRIVHRADSA